MSPDAPVTCVRVFVLKRPDDVLARFNANNGRWSMGGWARHRCDRKWPRRVISWPVCLPGAGSSIGYAVRRSTAIAGLIGPAFVVRVGLSSSSAVHWSASIERSSKPGLLADGHQTRARPGDPGGLGEQGGVQLDVRRVAADKLPERQIDRQRVHRARQGAAARVASQSVSSTADSPAASTLRAAQASASGSRSQPSRRAAGPSSRALHQQRAGAARQIQVDVFGGGRRQARP